MNKKHAPKFWSKVDRSGECWEWTGYKDRFGYGRFNPQYGVSPMLAHRYSWFLEHGEEPAGIVCHRCDNPACVNPAHLWIGSVRDNGEDCSRKRRANNQFGGQAPTHCVNGHELTPENTYWRAGRIAARDCRACQRERAKRYLQRKIAGTESA